MTPGAISTTQHFLHNLPTGLISKSVTLHQGGKSCQEKTH